MTSSSVTCIPATAGALTITADATPVFCATSGVTMPCGGGNCVVCCCAFVGPQTWASLPSPWPAFHPIFCIILAAADKPPAGAGGAASCCGAAAGASSVRFLYQLVAAWSNAGNPTRTCPVEGKPPHPTQPVLHAARLLSAPWARHAAASPENVTTVMAQQTCAFSFHMAS